MKYSICQITNCDKTTIARGWCHMHYKRWQIHGSPEVVLFPQEFHGKANTPVNSKWLARINRNGKEIRLGRYETPEEAYQARLSAEMRLA